MITLAEFQRRRRRVLDNMANGSAALFFAAPESIRSADTDYPFRQNSDFWYLTGFNEPEAALVLIKSDREQIHSVLFNRVRDINAEIWFGRRLGQEAALQTLGVDRALPYSEMDEQLPLLFNGLDVVYHAQGQYDYGDKIVFTALEKLRNGSRQNQRAPTTITDWRPWLHEMRLFKSPEEIAILRKAGDISAKAHTRAMQTCRPNLYEYHLEAEIHYEFMRHGARYPAYNTIVGGGKNGCILHYTENDAVLNDGDLVLIDAGCEYQGYAGDITRTFPINGRFSPAQRAIYNIVLAAQYQAISLLTPGNCLRDVNDRVIRTLVNGLIDVGVLSGDLEQLITEKAHQRFYMHGLGHWLGLDVHDVGSYGSSTRDRQLAPGMVLTVEPGLYIAPDADVPAQFRGMGIRIEDNVLITEQGNEILTAGVVKEIDAIEALMAEARI